MPQFTEMKAGVKDVYVTQLLQGLSKSPVKEYASTGRRESSDYLFFVVIHSFWQQCEEPQGAVSEFPLLLLTIPTYFYPAADRTLKSDRHVQSPRLYVRCCGLRWRNKCCSGTLNLMYG